MELSHQTKGKAPFMKFCKQFSMDFLTKPQGKIHQKPTDLPIMLLVVE